MNFELAVVLGVVFGSLAAVSAYVIAYAEYKRNWSFRGSAVRMSLRSAAVAFVFFFLAAIAIVAVFNWVR